MAYEHRTVEPKWQARWREAGLHKTPSDPAKPKFYALDMFPYPSGAGLHVGHCEGYTATDVITRWKRMPGFRVLHPMGWDAFGLPAENYAIKHGVHPRETTAAAIANFRRQIDAVGFAYDWEREIDTTDPAYMRWTQWIFLQAVRARSGLRGGRPDQLVPVVQDGPGQRRGQPGALRALRHASSCARTCASGCCASRATPTGCSRIWTSSTGRRRRWRCSATGSAAAKGPR